MRSSCPLYMYLESLVPCVVVVGGGVLVLPAARSAAARSEQLADRLHDCRPGGLLWLCRSCRGSGNRSCAAPELSRVLTARTGNPSGAPTPSLPTGGAVVTTPARSCAPPRAAWCRVNQPRSPLPKQAGIEPDRASVLQPEQKGRRYPAMARAASIPFQRQVLVQRRSGRHVERVGRGPPSVNDRIRPGHRSAGKIPSERRPGRPAPPRGTFFSSCCCLRRGVGPSSSGRSLLLLVVVAVVVVPPGRYLPPMQQMLHQLRPLRLMMRSDV
jgi:hypothetical protein